MPEFVLSFRAKADAGPDPEQEMEWGRWLAEISPRIVDGGHRVGGSQVVGEVDLGGTVLGGYLVVEAADIDAALAIARGCPGLQRGGAVDVAEVVE
jgi:hypothetical protein